MSSNDPITVERIREWCQQHGTSEAAKSLVLEPQDITLYAALLFLLERVDALDKSWTEAIRAIVAGEPGGYCTVREEIQCEIDPLVVKLRALESRCAALEGVLRAIAGPWDSLEIQEPVCRDMWHRRQHLYDEVCPSCSSEWWDTGYGGDNPGWVQPVEYLVAARARAALAPNRKEES